MGVVDAPSVKQAHPSGWAAARNPDRGDAHAACELCGGALDRLRSAQLTRALGSGSDGVDIRSRPCGVAAWLLDFVMLLCDDEA